MAAVGGFCLACGQMTIANNGRILRCETSNNVQRAWRDLLAERLKDKDMDIDVESVLGDTTPVMFAECILSPLKHSMKGRAS